MKRKSPMAKAIAKQLATPAGRAAAVASIAQTDPAAARRLQEKCPHVHSFQLNMSTRSCLDCGADFKQKAVL